MPGKAGWILDSSVVNDRLDTLRERTRYDPQEVEPRVLARVARGGLLPPRGHRARRPRTSRSRSRRRTSPASCTWATRSTARCRTCSRACAGCRGATRSGRSGPTTPASPPRWSSRSSSPQEGLTRRAARPRGSSSAASGSGGSATARAIVEQYKRLGASCDYERERFTMDERLRARGLQGVQGALRQGLHLPRQLHGELGPGLAARRSRTSRSSTARSRTRSTTSTTRSSPATATSRSRPCGRRRCSPTRRSR